MSMTLHLLEAKLRAARNSLAGGRGRLRVIIVATLGIGFAVAVYWVSVWFFGYCIEIEPIGELAVRRILGMTLMVVLSLLCFSNLVGAFANLYLAEDLDLIVARPVPAEALYSARLAETMVQASWMLVPFSLPLFLAAGQVLDARPGYLPALVLIYAALAAIAASLGVALSLLLTSALSARRARQLFIAAGSIALGVMVFVLRSLEPERFMNPDERASVLEMLQTLRATDVPWLPSTWALDALWPFLGYGGSRDAHPLLLLASFGAASFFVTGWLFRALFSRAYSRAQQGLATGRGALPRDARPLSRSIARAAHGGGRLSFKGSLWVKDWKVFARDTAQWSQLLILGGIAAVYILNFKYIRGVSGTGLISDLGLHFLNLALGGFVVLALAVRFAFPAVSLEGRAFWLIRCSPHPARELLVSKRWTSFVPLTLVALLLMVSTHAFIGTSVVLQVASLLTMPPLVFGLAGLGVGLGAVYPRFDTDDAARVATGLGGVLYMLLSVAMLVGVVLSSILPTAAALRWFERGRHLHHLHHLHGVWVAAAVMGALVAVSLPLVAGEIALRLGARRLEARE